MDLVSLSFSVCVMMVFLPGPAQLSSSDKNCSCPQIPQRSLTKPPQHTCLQTGSRFRYTCIDGYLRKAGTSDLTKCKDTGGAPQWSEPSLVCIPDPKITTTTTTAQRSITTGKTTSTTQMMQTVSSAPEEGNVTEAAAHETVTQTARKTETIHISTPLPRVANTSQPSISQTESLKTTTVATVSTIILVIVCSLGIIFLLYRRRSKRRIPVPTEDVGDLTVPASVTKVMLPLE